MVPPVGAVVVVPAEAVRRAPVGQVPVCCLGLALLGNLRGWQAVHWQPPRRLGGLPGGALEAGVSAVWAALLAQVVGLQQPTVQAVAPQGSA